MGLIDWFISKTNTFPNFLNFPIYLCKTTINLSFKISYTKNMYFMKKSYVVIWILIKFWLSTCMPYVEVVVKMHGHHIYSQKPL